jgi:RNA polymerase sigma-70 factor (ECF subfamily)
LPWLLGIATNRIGRARDAERRWLRAHDPEPDTSDVFEDADSRLNAERLAPWLHDALAALRRRDREVLLLHVAAELTVEQVAAALDVPVGTIKSRLHRARRILAAQLEVHR